MKTSLTFLAIAAMTIAMALPSTPSAAADLAPGSYSFVTERSAANLTVASPIGKLNAEIPFRGGTLTVDQRGNISATDAVLDMQGVSAGNSLALKQLKGSSGLAVDKYPAAEFVSTSARLDGDELTVEGNLTVRGVTRPLTVSGTVLRANERRFSVSLEGRIDRTQFGITTGRPLYSKQADLRLRIVARKGR